MAEVRLQAVTKRFGETVVVDDVNDKLVFSTDGQMAQAA